jgi:hypothetical protein
MKLPKILALLAALVLALTLTIWSSGGFHRGWSQTQIPTTHIDPITEIEFVTYEDGFVAGMDFVFLGVGITTLLFASSIVLMIRQRRKLQKPHPA